MSEPKFVGISLLKWYGRQPPKEHASYLVVIDEVVYPAVWGQPDGWRWLDGTEIDPVVADIQAWAQFPAVPILTQEGRQEGDCQAEPSAASASVDLAALAPALRAAQVAPAMALSGPGDCLYDAWVQAAKHVGIWPSRTTYWVFRLLKRLAQDDLTHERTPGLCAPFIIATLNRMVGLRTVATWHRPWFDRALWMATARTRWQRYMARKGDFGTSGGALSTQPAIVLCHATHHAFFLRTGRLLSCYAVLAMAIGRQP